MPDHARTTTAALLIRHPTVEMVTPTYQSDDETLDGGVCRGMASRWIGAQLLGGKNVAQFRILANNTDGKVNMEFVRYQAAFNAVGKEFDSACVQYKTLRAEADRLKGVFNGTLDKGWFEWMPTAQSVADAEEAALKAEKTLLASVSILYRYMSGGLHEVKKVTDVDYTTFEQALHTHLTGNGFYYIGLGGTHAIAFYIAQAGECLFIDANTGEWKSPDLATLSTFFSDYMSSLYLTEYAGKRVDIYHLPHVLDAT